MKKITLEWNAVTTWEDEDRSGRDSLGQIIQAHGRLFEVGIVTTAASENAKGGKFPTTGTEFRDRLKKHHWDQLEYVLTQGVYGLTYLDLCRFAPADGNVALIESLWGIVRGNIPRDWSTFAQEKGIPEGEEISAPSFQKWRNHWCDVFSMEAHIAANRDVFVTGDQKNFKGNRKQNLIDLGIGDICTYTEAWEKHGDE